MSLMTDSKIIHEAQESQEFEQNPQYYHKNINPDQIHSDINALFSHVNTFVKKFNFYNFTTRIINPKNTCTKTNKTNVNSKQQIHQLAYQTQNFIQGLTWGNQSRQISQFKQINKKQQRKVTFDKSIDPQDIKAKFNTTKKKLPSSENFYQTYDEKDFKINNSTQIKSLKSSLQNFPKTVNIQRKNSSKINQNTNLTSKYINSPFKQTQSHYFEDFDDQITVVNELNSKTRRKYYKNNGQKEIMGQKMKNQLPFKLTKKKLLQKILNLENTVQQLQFQKYQNQQIFRKNNILYVPVQIKSHGQDIQLKNNDRIVNKPQRNLQNKLNNQSKFQSKRFHSLNAKNSINLAKAPSIHENHYSQPRAKSSLKNQDKKVSLKQWADQVW